MASTSLPTGCFKCGRPGHWSRDCPSQPAGTPASGGGASDGRPPSTAGGFGGASGGRPPSTAGGFSGASGGRFSNSGGFSGGNSWRGRSSDGNATQGSNNVPKEPVKKAPRTRPKLTPELLLSEKGLGYVLEKMPEMVTIKGREDTVVRDLKSFLEGYMHWHSLLLPYFSFDQFVDKVEKLGSTKRVRTCTRDLRDKIVYGKGSTGDKEVEAEASEVSSPKSTLPKDTPAGPGSEADHDVSPPDDIITNDEPDLPVNADEFEDFFRQGIVEPSDTQPSSTLEGGSAQPGLQGNTSPVRKFPSLEDDVSTVTPIPTTSSIIISESAAARMEANRLRALERAKARHARNVEL